MAVDKIGYRQIASTSSLVKSGPTGFFGVICVVAGTVIIYDNTAASGTIIFTKTMAVGDEVDFGTGGVALGTGLYVNAGTGTFNVMFT